MSDHQIWLWPAVQRHLTHVKVNQKTIAALADSWARDEFVLPDWRLPVLPEEDGDDFVQFLGINSALNFGLIDVAARRPFLVGWNRQVWTGSRALSACLMRAIYDYGYELLDAGFLANLDFNQVQIIFGNRYETVPLLEERWKILKEIGRTLGSEFGGQFSSLLRAANYRILDYLRPKRRCQGIISRLVNYFPTAFGERNYYRPARLKYNLKKKARLFVAMYHGRAVASGGHLPLIGDISCLEPIVDYRVAAASRYLGITNYSNQLTAKIASGAVLPFGGREEQEIRLATEHAVAELLRQINDRRPRQMGPINICHLDYRLWHDYRSRQLDYPSPRSHHLTLTTAY